MHHHFESYKYLIINLTTIFDVSEVTGLTNGALRSSITKISPYIPYLNTTYYQFNKLSHKTQLASYK